MAFRSKIFIDIYSYVRTVTEEIKKNLTRFNMARGHKNDDGSI